MSPGSGWESVLIAAYPFPSGDVVWVAGLVSICLDYLCKGFFGFTELYLLIAIGCSIWTTIQPVGAWRWFSQVQRSMWNNPLGTCMSQEGLMAAQTEFTFSFYRLKVSEPAAWTLGVGLVWGWEADGIRVVFVEHLPGIRVVGLGQVGPADPDAEKGMQGGLQYGNSHRLCSLVWRDSSSSARNLLT